MKEKDQIPENWNSASYVANRFISDIITAYKEHWGWNTFEHYLTRLTNTIQREKDAQICICGLCKCEGRIFSNGQG